MAIADYTEAIRLDPKYAKAYNNRGAAYKAKGQHDRATSDFTEAIRLNPEDAEAHNGLAWLLATCPRRASHDGPRAVDHATTACELTKWNTGNYLDTLAAAYAEAREVR